MPSPTARRRLRKLEDSSMRVDFYYVDLWFLAQQRKKSNFNQYILMIGGL